MVPMISCMCQRLFSYNLQKFPQYIFFNTGVKNSFTPFKIFGLLGYHEVYDHSEEYIPEVMNNQEVQFNPHIISFCVKGLEDIEVFQLVKNA
jgi:hypothetical protein